MTQTREKAHPQAPTERAALAANRAGERLGLLVGQTALRLQRASRFFREEADRMDTPATDADSDQQKPESGRKSLVDQATTERAEELVDQFGQRVRHWALVGSLQTKRTLARLREDAEDMWVEAQEMRGEWQYKREHA